MRLFRFPDKFSDKADDFPDNDTSFSLQGRGSFLKSYEIPHCQQAKKISYSPNFEFLFSLKKVILQKDSVIEPVEMTIFFAFYKQKF